MAQVIITVAVDTAAPRQARLDAAAWQSLQTALLHEEPSYFYAFHFLGDERTTLVNLSYIREIAVLSDGTEA